MKDNILNKIRYKVRWVNKKYPELHMKDLMQEARELIIKLENDNNGVAPPEPYILSAVSNHFSNLMRQVKVRRKSPMVDIERLADQEDTSASEAFEELENKIDRNSFMKFLNKNPDLSDILKSLMDGDNVEELATKFNTTPRTIYRKLSRIKQMREKWE